MEQSGESTISLPTIQLLEPGHEHGSYLFTRESSIDSALDSTMRVKPSLSKSKTALDSRKREKSESRNPSCIELPKDRKGELVECCFKTAGCKDKFYKGSIEEKEHQQTCQFRPIPCLMHHICSQIVPYPNFLLHHMKHFLTPTFSTYLNTTVFVEQEDFKCNNRWQPRWINCYGKDFFVLVSHKLSGLWYFWVWMLGTEKEAENFFYEIEIFKGATRKAGTFPVLSLRTSEDEIEKKEISLSVTDYQLKRISQIGDNLVESFEMDLTIYKNKNLVPSRMCLQ